MAASQRLNIGKVASQGTRKKEVPSSLVHSHLKSLDPLVTEDKFDVLSDNGVRAICELCESASTY